MEANVTVKKQIIENEINMVVNTIFQLEARHRVSKKVGDSPEALKIITDELVKLEMRLDEYNKIIAELDDDK